MTLDWKCTFNFKRLPPGFHIDAYLSRVHGFLKQFEGEVFENNHDFQRHLFGWQSYLSRQQLDPQLPGPCYDVRSNKVYIANRVHGYCSFGGLFYVDERQKKDNLEELSSL